MVTAIKSTTKPKALKAPKAAPSHPSYLDMVESAIEELHQRNGSSRAAIKNYIVAAYELPADRNGYINAYLRQALQRGIDDGIFKVNGSGTSAYYSLDKSTGTSQAKKTEESSDGSSETKKTSSKSTKATAAPKAKKNIASTKAKKVTASPKSQKTASRKVGAPPTKKAATSAKKGATAKKGVQKKDTGKKASHSAE
jgi:histone H1/5